MLTVEQHSQPVKGGQDQGQNSFVSLALSAKIRAELKSNVQASFFFRISYCTGFGKVVEQVRQRLLKFILEKELNVRRTYLDMTSV